jgi:small subunit ribosomal protein S1
LNRRFSDQDLEDEIAAAMGDSIEDLMAGQVEQKADEQSIEIEERYVAVVAKIHRDSVLVELPGQQNGVIPLKQFEELPEVGSQLEVVVVGFSAAEQLYDVIVPGASVDVADWSDLAEGVVVDAKITGHNKGGLECEINRIRGFIPASQVSLYRVEDFSSFVDETMSCVVTEANEERGNLVLSRRAILEREREAAKEQLMAELAVGQTREGIVTRLQKFGAFVDLGGVDGLIHISQLSWDNIRDPSEVVEEGQKVKVRIEKIDPTTGKIGLSYRDLMHHPWEGIETKYHVGTVVTGTVSKLMEFGAFVKLESGVEGLVHISELSHKRVNRVSHVVEEGQRVEVKVLSVDAESQRISLSMKQVQESVDEGDAAGDTSDEPEIKHVPKTPVKSLKGGTTGSAGGEQFGLKW